jgi:hypothetical protein
MIEFRPGGCRRHRDALIDFIDRREPGPRTDAALQHVERCRACEDALEATALTIAALRRLVAATEPSEPAADAWARLRARVDRPRAALWRWRSTLAGVALSAGLVATLVAPRAIWHPSPQLSQDGQAVALATDLSSRLEWRRAFERRNLPVPEPPTTNVLLIQPSAATWTGPDGHRVTFEAQAVTPPTGRLN